MEFTLKCTLVILACLMLVSATNLTSNILTIGTEMVQASPEIYFNLHAMVCPDPYYGYYGGYHDLWAKIEPELEKIGINLEVVVLSDMYDLWYLMWDVSSEDEITPGTNPDGTYNPDGWDLTIIEWWLMPTGLLWVESMVYGGGADTPPMFPEYGGFNIFPYRNERSDELLWKGQHVLDAETRKSYLWKWQKEQMHDPPIINVYYPHVYQMYGSYVNGWYPTLWFWDNRYLRIDTALVEELHDKGYLTDAVRTRLIDEKALIYAVTEDVWMWNPFFVDTYTAEAVNALTMCTLYSITLDPWPPQGQPADARHYKSFPELASGPPQFLGPDQDGPYAGKMRVRVPLRQGVKWSDGVEFNATDVKFTYDRVIDPEWQSTGCGDVAFLVEAVEYVYDAEGNINPYQIDFILTTDEPYPDFECVFSNEWGTVVLPAHYFTSLPEWEQIEEEPSTFIDHESNTFEGAKEIPAMGPFKLAEKEGKEYVKLVKNPYYFGYSTENGGLAPVGLDWGPYGIEEFYFKWVPDATARFTALKLHEVDFGEYPIASVDRYEALMGDPSLTIFATHYVASNPVWMNLKNPHLSNRYVRLAIAHAIPYPEIFAEILPGWGISDPIKGGTWIIPWQYYTYDGVTVPLFNEELPPYEYNIDKAKMYMDMWYYAQVGTDYTKGPVGDADFSGLVELDDFLIWVNNFGTTPTDWTPGNDIDPDFDNNGEVEMSDFYLLAENFGREYPFPGAW